MPTQKIVIMKQFWKKRFWCGEEEWCEKCEVCKYEQFLEWAESVAPSGSHIQRNYVIENFKKYVLPAYEKVVEEEKKLLEEYAEIKKAEIL